MALGYSMPHPLMYHFWHRNSCRQLLFVSLSYHGPQIFILCKSSSLANTRPKRAHLLSCVYPLLYRMGDHVPPHHQVWNPIIDYLQTFMGWDPSQVLFSQFSQFFVEIYDWRWKLALHHFVPSIHIRIGIKIEVRGLKIHIRNWRKLSLMLFFGLREPFIYLLVWTNTFAAQS